MRLDGRMHLQFSLVFLPLRALPSTLLRVRMPPSLYVKERASPWKTTVRRLTSL